MRRMERLQMLRRRPPPSRRSIPSTSLLSSGAQFIACLFTISLILKLACRFSTKTELLMDFIGLICSAAAGAANVRIAESLGSPAVL